MRSQNRMKEYRIILKQLESEHEGVQHVYVIESDGEVYEGCFLTPGSLGVMLKKGKAVMELGKIVVPEISAPAMSHALQKVSLLAGGFTKGNIFPRTGREDEIFGWRLGEGSYDLVLSVGA